MNVTACSESGHVRGVAPGEQRQESHHCLWVLDCDGYKVYPSFCAHEQPLLFYAKACYEKWLPIEVMQSTFDNIEEKMSTTINK